MSPKISPRLLKLQNRLSNSARAVGAEASAGAKADANVDDRIFLAYKPPSVGSNAFLSRFKRVLRCTKAGFSGTLDPFAKGVLLIATGNYTKLLPHLPLSQKRYVATLWLGLQSESLDIENVRSVAVIPPLQSGRVRDVVESMRGVHAYTPPRFCAKRIDGKRAYTLARLGHDVALAPSRMEIFNIALLHYNHPFVSFSVSVSKGTYVRSIGEMIAQQLGVCGALCSLERVREGYFGFDTCSTFAKQNSILRACDFKQIRLAELDIHKMLAYPVLCLSTLREHFYQGKKLNKDMIKFKGNGRFIVNFEDFFSIIEAGETDVKYLVNRIKNVDFGA